LGRSSAITVLGEYRQAIEDYDRAIGTIEQYTQEHFERTDELLPIKGNVLEPGGRTTHKGQILRLYEEGVDPGRDQSRHWSG